MSETIEGLKDIEARIEELKQGASKALRAKPEDLLVVRLMVTLYDPVTGNAIEGTLQNEQLDLDGDRDMERRCRVCGCTETRACIVNGVPRHWVEWDLCSACAPKDSYPTEPDGPLEPDPLDDPPAVARLIAEEEAARNEPTPEQEQNWQERNAYQDAHDQEGDPDA